MSLLCLSFPVYFVLLILQLQDNGDITPENGSHRGVQYPFSVNEKVIIKVNYRVRLFHHLCFIYKHLVKIPCNIAQGNRRTPDKFVGKEAVITSQCLNGWLVAYTNPIILTGLFDSEPGHIFNYSDRTLVNCMVFYRFFVVIDDGKLHFMKVFA